MGEVEEIGVLRNVQLLTQVIYMGIHNEEQCLLASKAHKS